MFSSCPKLRNVYAESMEFYLEDFRFQKILCRFYLEATIAENINLNQRPFQFL